MYMYVCALGFFSCDMPSIRLAPKLYLIRLKEPYNFDRLYNIHYHPLCLSILIKKSVQYYIIKDAFFNRSQVC